jgi:hypothetical protein
MARVSLYGEGGGGGGGVTIGVLKFDRHVLLFAYSFLSPSNNQQAK